MPLQDLTPQLRTRLSRVERVVGLFVALAILLLVAGLVYYVWLTATRKGWFLIKAPYFTFVDTAAGLKVGDPIKLMGFDVGQITRIDAQPPEDIYYNVYVEFVIRSPYYGYLWTQGSRAKVTAADFLGNRYIEVTKGTNGQPTYRQETHRWLLGIPRKAITGVWDDKLGAYLPHSHTNKPYWLLSDESPALTERLETLVAQVESALPAILNLTNQLAGVLSHSAGATSNLNALVLQAQPTVTNLALITSHLTDPKGSLGEWLLPTNLHRHLVQTFGQAAVTLTNVDTNFAALASNLNLSLENLATLTSNLNAQVQTNDQILSEISQAIVHADELVQGLKRHWLLRSAFRKSAPQPPPRSPNPAGSKRGHR